MEVGVLLLRLTDKVGVLPHISPRLGAVRVQNVIGQTQIPGIMSVSWPRC